MVFPGYAWFEFLSEFSACMMVFEPRYQQLNNVMERAILVLWVGIPLSIILFCYTSVYYTVRRHNRIMGNSMQESTRLRGLRQGRKEDNASCEARRMEKEQQEEEERKEERRGGEEEEEERTPVTTRTLNSQLEKDQEILPTRLQSNSSHAEAIQENKVQKINVQEGMSSSNPDATPNTRDKTKIEKTSDRHDNASKPNVDDEDQACDPQRLEHTRPILKKRRESSTKDCHVDKNSATRKQNKAEAKVTRTVLAVFVGFFTCWIPPLIAAVANQSLPNKSHSWIVTITYFAALSTAINPFIYAATNRQFRKTYVSLFKCDKIF
jgi:hypothetical protein